MLVVPSRLESGPLVALEAMACGAPVIAFDVSSLPEVVDHGETGMLVPIDDVEAFCRAIRGLASDPARLENMRRKCRETVVARFSHRATVSRYLELVTS